MVKYIFYKRFLWIAFFMSGFSAFIFAQNAASSNKPQPDDDPFLDVQDENITESDKDIFGSFIDVLLKEPGFSILADYTIIGAYLPGWASPPWNDDFYTTEVFHDNQPFGAEMRARVGLDIQLSPVLRFWQAVKFSIPGMKIDLTEFYGYYNFINRAILQIGKYDYAWGISPNFNYTDLLARLPENETNNPGDLYLARLNMPVGVGGVEILGFTRSGYINTEHSELNEFAFGGKFNLALREADINFGALYFKRMPFRMFMSLKSTIFKSTEIYSEFLTTIDSTTWNNAWVSFSFGFFNEYLNRRLGLNAELFYNGEYDASFLRQENILEDTKKVFPFIHGFNTVVNINYKPDRFSNLRFGMKFLYAIEDGSGQIIPGLTFEPAPHLKIYIAVPLVIGDKNGTYYTVNEDKYNRPFSLIMALSINGTYKFSHY